MPLQSLFIAKNNISEVPQHPRTDNDVSGLSRIYAISCARCRLRCVFIDSKKKCVVHFWLI